MLIIYTLIHFWYTFDTLWYTFVTLWYTFIIPQVQSVKKVYHNPLKLTMISTILNHPQPTYQPLSTYDVTILLCITISLWYHNYIVTSLIDKSWKWLTMVGNYWEWLRIVGNGWHYFDFFYTFFCTFFWYTIFTVRYTLLIMLLHWLLIDS